MFCKNLLYYLAASILYRALRAQGSKGTGPFGKDRKGQALWEGQERTGQDSGALKDYFCQKSKKMLETLK